MRRAACLLILLTGLTGCGALPFGDDRSSVYDLQREALLAYDNDENAKAEKLLQALLRISPNDALTLFYLGNLYARTGRPEQAIDAYQKSLMINGADPRPWHNLGVIRLRQAQAAFIQAFDLTNPDDALHARVEAVIRAMGDIPLDAMREKPQGKAKP
jgi:Flp pilus assembly protein TadD